MIKKTYRIPDMTCSNCAMHLESIEDDLDGIRKIKASYHQQTLVVEFDESVVTEAAILQAIRRIHYTPVPVE